MPFTVNMPKLSPTMEEGQIAKWHKKVGDFVEAGEVLLEITTDKATLEHAALDEGWLRQILVKEGKSAILNQPIALFTETKDENIASFVIEKEKKPMVEKATKPKSGTKKETAETGVVAFKEPAFTPEPPVSDYRFTPNEPTARIKASPLAKKLAKEKGLDLSTVQGSGPGGRITTRDLERAQPAGVVAFGKKELPLTPPGSYEEIPLTPMRQAIAKRLQQSKSFIPHYYLKKRVRADNLIALREQLKNVNIHVSFNDLVVRATALALREHPEMNCGFNSVNQTILAFKTIDIAIAVAIDDGLITPIIRHADFKHLAEISQETKSLAKRAREGKLKENEYKGGSFTISNLGMYGLDEFTAVINPPQAAILAVGGLIESPVIQDGGVTTGTHLSLVLSLDHRVIDGATGALFLKTLAHLLENPVSLSVG